MKKFRLYQWWCGRQVVNDEFDTLQEALDKRESYKDQEWGEYVRLDISDFFPTNSEGAGFEAPDTVVLYNEGGYNCTKFTFSEIAEFMKAAGKKVD